MPQPVEIEFWRIYRQGARKLALLLFGVAVVSLFLNAFVLERKYKSSVTFWARKSTLNPSQASTNVETYRGILLNNTLINQVMDEFKLRGEPHEMRLKDFFDAVEFKTKRQSEAVTVEFLFPDRDLGPQILNRLADLAVERGNMLYADQQQAAHQLVEREYQSAKKELDDLAGEWAEFRKGARLQDAFNEINWRGQLGFHLANGPTLFAGGPTTDLAGTVQVEAMIAARIAEIKSLAATLGGSAGPAKDAPETLAVSGVSATHPLYSKLAPRLAEARAELESLRARHKLMDTQFASNQATVEALGRSWGPDEVRDKSYEKQMDALGDAYREIATRYEAIKVKALENAEVVLVVDRAIPPDTWARPRLAFNTALALVIAFLLGSAGLFARDYFQQVAAGMKERS